MQFYSPSHTAITSLYSTKTRKMLERGIQKVRVVFACSFKALESESETFRMIMMYSIGFAGSEEQVWRDKPEERDRVCQHSLLASPTILGTSGSLSGTNTSKRAFGVVPRDLTRKNDEGGLHHAAETARFSGKASLSQDCGIGSPLLTQVKSLSFVISVELMRQRGQPPPTQR